MTKYMKYDNMVITIYFDNQTKSSWEIKNENSEIFQEDMRV